MLRSASSSAGRLSQVSRLSPRSLPRVSISRPINSVLASGKSINRTAPSLLLASQARAFSWTPVRQSSQDAVAGSIPVAQQAPALSQAEKTSAATSEVPSVESAATTSTHPTHTISVEAADAAAQDIHFPQPPALPTNPSIEQLIAQNPDNVAEVLSSPEAVHAAMRVGDLKLMGLEHSVFNISGWLRDAMEMMHVGLGIPWWGTILVVAFCMRLALFPLVVKMQGNNARLQSIQPQQQALMTKMTEAKKAGDQQAMAVYAAQIGKLFKEHNCSPFNSLLLPLVQVPLFMTLFFAVRGMVLLPVPQLKEGGLGWFMDLTAADPYYILPVTSLIFQLGVLEMGADGTGGANVTRQGQHMKNAFRVLSVVALPFVGGMASALTLYWSLSAAFTLAQASLLRQHFVRRYFKLPIPKPAPKPAGYVPEKPPTFRDSIIAARDALKGQAEEATKRAIEHRQRDQKNRPVMAAAASSSMQQLEVIREVGSSSSTSSVEGAASSEREAGNSIPAATSKSKSRGNKNASPILDAVAQAKANRIAAARARRQSKS